jgi:hypothetical protein
MYKGKLKFLRLLGWESFRCYRESTVGGGTTYIDVYMRTRDQDEFIEFVGFETD